MRIVRKDGTPTDYYWSDKDGSTPAARTLYKKTVEGVKRMKGVHYDATRKRIVKH